MLKLVALCIRSQTKSERVDFTVNFFSVRQKTTQHIGLEKLLKNLYQALNSSGLFTESDNRMIRTQNYPSQTTGGRG